MNLSSKYLALAAVVGVGIGAVGAAGLQVHAQSMQQAVVPVATTASVSTSPASPAVDNHSDGETADDATGSGVSGASVDNHADGETADDANGASIGEHADAADVGSVGDAAESDTGAPDATDATETSK
jgi:hypothetical protein